MHHSTYLIVGSGHAGLAALDAIRSEDSDGSITLVSEEETFPYSPTILPYVVSGEIGDEKIFLRCQEDLTRMRVRFRKGDRATSVNSAAHEVALQGGEVLSYDKLLLATGAAPSEPPVDGIEETPHYVLRRLRDAIQLRREAQRNSSAIVLGAGLIGLHAAENLARLGLEVTVVEMLPRVLSGYLDAPAAGLVEAVFREQSIEVITGAVAESLTRSNGDCVVFLDSGEELCKGLVVVATGSTPRAGPIAAAEMEVEKGIVVDNTMRTTARDIWAAGDVAQVPDFFDRGNTLTGTLFEAVEQGRVAGRDMVNSPYLAPYPGGLNANIYRFFGNRAFSAGQTQPSALQEDVEVAEVFLPGSRQYQRLVFQEDILIGVSSVNAVLDPGVVFQLIRRKVRLGKMKAEMASFPMEAGRLVMSKSWR